MEALCEMASYYVTQNTLKFAFPYVSPSVVLLSFAILPSTTNYGQHYIQIYVSFMDI